MVHTTVTVPVMASDHQELRCRLPKSQKMICWFSSGDDMNCSMDISDWNRNSSAMPARISVWALTWRNMAMPNSTEAASMHIRNAPSGTLISESMEMPMASACRPSAAPRPAAAARPSV